MPSQFVYGRRDDRLIHVRDLNPLMHRGRQCGCVCQGCGRALQAHMGSAKAWHFQHDVDNGSCNPQPMTLLHAFVRDTLAERRNLWLPGGTTELIVDIGGSRRKERVVIEDRVFEFSDGRPELRVGQVQPDVVFSILDKWDLALEVRVTHAVDDAKREKLRALFRDAIEFDVSDMPTGGISEAELERVLRERHRWKWLIWTEHRQAEERFKHRIFWESRVWKVDIGFFHKAQTYKPVASAKLRRAQQRLVWAQGELKKIKAASGTKAQRASALGALELTDRFAVACAFMELQPQALPVYFCQRVQDGLGHHPYAWQLLIFAAFGLRDGTFGSDEVEMWAELALPDCVHPRLGTRTRNGFSQTRAALHGYLAQLTAQGLLRSNSEAAAEHERFSRAFANRVEFHHFLTKQGA